LSPAKLLFLPRQKWPNYSLSLAIFVWCRELDFYFLG